MTNFKNIIKENKDFMIKTRRYLHENPELSSQEYNSSSFFKKYLDEWNIPYSTAGNTSIVAKIVGNQNGKTIAIRGDFDALPIQENTGLNFSSKNNGVMHACGHDFHGTYMLTLAKILKDLKNEINGTIKIIFQEGEEIGAGAPQIIEAGLVSDVNNIVGLHVSPTEEQGFFSLNYGIMSAHGGGIEIYITSEDENPLVAAAELVTSVSGIIMQRHSRDNQAVAVPTLVKILENKNGLPYKVQICFNFRTYDYEISKLLNNIFDDTVSGIKKIHKVKIETIHRKPSTSIDNDKESTDRAARIIEKLHGKESVLWSKPFTGGENFSRFQQIIPGVFVHIGAAPKDHKEGIYADLHTSDVIFNESALEDGVEFFLEYIFDYLNN